MPERAQLAPSGRMWALAATVATGGFLFGYDTGVASGALLYLREGMPELDDSSLLQESFVSAAVGGAATGAALAGTLGERFGRQRALLCADALFMAGALAMAGATGVYSLLAGRVLVGLGVGVASAVVPLYIAECAPTRSRGALVTANTLMITSGQLVAYVSNIFFARAMRGDARWRWMLGIAALPAAAQSVGLLLLPESPRWLARRGRAREAALALARLRDPDEARDELEAIEQELDDEEHVPSLGEERSLLDGNRSGRSRRRAWSELFARAENRYALVVAAGLQAFQQLVGINTVMYYSTQILSLAGFDDKQEALKYGAVVAAGNVVGTIAGLALIDRLGRRTLALCSLAGCFASLLMLSRAFRDATPDGPLAFCGLAAYILSFSPGMGPVPWAVQSEVFPSRVRSLGTGVATVVNWSSNFIVAQTFLSLVDGVGKARTFVLFAGFTAAAFVFVQCIVFETKGLSMEEVATVLRGRVRSSHRSPQAHPR